MFNTCNILYFKIYFLGNWADLLKTFKGWLIALRRCYNCSWHNYRQSLLVIDIKQSDDFKISITGKWNKN